jgi:hypothetical protein
MGLRNGYGAVQPMGYGEKRVITLLPHIAVYSLPCFNLFISFSQEPCFTQKEGKRRVQFPNKKRCPYTKTLFLSNMYFGFTSRTMKTVQIGRKRVTSSNTTIRRFGFEIEG